MEVVAYLQHSDFLLEDEQGVAVIGGSHYVLSVGDQVVIKQKMQDENVYKVHIRFAYTRHQGLYEDEIELKFEGCRQDLIHYLQHKTVH